MIRFLTTCHAKPISSCRLNEVNGDICRTKIWQISRLALLARKDDFILAAALQMFIFVTLLHFSHLLWEGSEVGYSKNLHNKNTTIYLK